MNNFYLLDTDPKYNYLLDATEFYIKKLLPKYKTLDISICVEDSLDDNAEGFTENTDDLSRPREFIAYLSVTTENMLLTLAHECIHIKQYVTTLDYNEEEAYAEEYNLYNSFVLEQSDSPNG